MKTLATRLIAAAVLCGLSAARAHAQECGPDQVIPWWPRTNATAGSESLTAAERTAVVAQLGAVEALTRRTPYATPRERVRTTTLFGATATFGRFHEEPSEGLYVLFTAGGQSPTLPVSREEYLRAMIFTLEGKDQEKIKAAAAITSKTPYERWMADAPERKRRNEELYAIVASTNPAQAATMRADMEKAELAETEKLEKGDAYERAQVAKNLAGLTLLGDKYPRADCRDESGGACVIRVAGRRRPRRRRHAKRLRDRPQESSLLPRRRLAGPTASDPRARAQRVQGVPAAAGATLQAARLGGDQEDGELIRHGRPRDGRQRRSLAKPCSKVIWYSTFCASMTK